MKKSILTGAALALTLCAGVADARNIVVTNDDGLSSNVVALYKALKAEGHDVIVSVPCQNQSGMGAAIKVGQPLAPLAVACRSDAAGKGAPGAGAMTRKDIPAGDFYYVDGTPVMAMLYGVDVVGKRRWGKAADLVISGPNEGQNVGPGINGSGTVSAAQAASSHGLSAIALSAGMRTIDEKALANPASAQVAALAVELVDRLDSLSQGGRMLPERLALNVNFPDKLDGVKWRASRIGTYEAYDMRFVNDMANDATPLMKGMAKELGMTLPHLPGLSFGMSDAAPTAAQQNDEGVVYKTAIAVSPMQAGFEAQGLDGWADWVASSVAAGK